MTQEQLDLAENNAIQQANKAAYLCSDKASPEKQTELYNTMNTYIKTGIRFMREEIEKLNM